MTMKLHTKMEEKKKKTQPRLKQKPCVSPRGLCAGNAMTECNIDTEHSSGICVVLHKQGSAISWPSHSIVIHTPADYG